MACSNHLRLVDGCWMLMEGSIEDVPWYWWLIVVLALLYTTHDVQYRMAENLRLLQNPIINSTYRAVMRMTLNWKDARIFDNSWSSLFTSTWGMKSLHWNGLLSRAYSENWFPQVKISSWSLFLYFYFLILEPALESLQKLFGGFIPPMGYPRLGGNIFV